MKAAGTSLRFDPLPIGSEEDWGALQTAIARWVLAHGGDARLARTAAAASLADTNGDSALAIDDAETRRSLAAMPLVGDAASPFVLDGGLFYLRRNFARECAVAAMLRERLDAPATPALVAIDPDTLFADATDPAIAGQRAALHKVRGRALFVLTGAPGSGKTTTVLRMLMLLAREHAGYRDNEWPRIALAAPTGKAAQRMRQSLLDATPGGFPAAWHEALAHVQARASEAGTVHRLLGMRGDAGTPRFDRARPLPIDLLVVDEASMLDLAMLRRLLAAMPASAPLILVGDADQLDSVGTGSVLQDVVAAFGEDDAHLQRLRHSFRADRVLLPLNEAVRAGDAAGFFAALDAASPQASLRSLDGRGTLADALKAWGEGLLADIRAGGLDDVIDETDGDRIIHALRVLRSRQLLCALREGPFGATGANTALERQLATALQPEAATAGEGAPWYPGRRILITRNDPASGLFNGDIGLCLRGPDRLRVWFDGEEGPRVFEIAELPAHESAFALTVHKAQGSEYEEVAVLPPPRADHPLLSRQWFYTAISRTRHRVEIWGSEAVITAAITSPARRVSGLGPRLDRPD